MNIQFVLNMMLTLRKMELYYDAVLEPLLNTYGIRNITKLH